MKVKHVGKGLAQAFMACIAQALTMDGPGSRQRKNTLGREGGGWVPLPRQERASGGQNTVTQAAGPMLPLEPHLDDFYVHAGFHAGKNI